MQAITVEARPIPRSAPQVTARSEAGDPRLAPALACLVRNGPYYLSDIPFAFRASVKIEPAREKTRWVAQASGAPASAAK